MKYDSSMTHLNDTVMANLRRMCSRDKAIIEKYCTENATPAQLQDFLKSNCSNSGYTDISEGINFWCSKSQGVRISLGFPVNNDGDKTLTLSWSQATKFILNNWKDILEKSEPEKATEAKPTYKDILLEHYLNFDMSRFEKFAKEACVEYYFEASPSCDHECKSHWKSECLSKWRDDIEDCDLEILKKYLVPADVNEEKPVCNTPEPPAASEIVPANAEKYVFACDGCRYDKQGCCNYPETQNDYCINGDKKICSDPPAQDDTAATVFDYSELDSDTADKLREVSEKVISIKARYILETAQQVKIAHDLLAKNGNGMFGAWCVSVGFTRQTGDNYLKIVKLFDNLSDEQRENLAKLTEGNMNLLYAITKPSAPPELVKAVKNGDITNHKDFIAMKKQLEEANKRAENAEMLSLTYKQNCDQIDKLYCKMRDDNTNLEKRIRELEKRPVDVAVEQNDDVMNELEQLRKENERLRDKNVKNFLLHMTIEEFEQLLDMTESSEYIHSIVSKADIIRL